MALDPQHIAALYSAILDKARAAKLFPGGVTGAEPDNPPGQGPAVALILGPLTPLPRASGLAETSCRLEFTVRITLPRSKKTPEEVDRALLYASVVLINAFSGDFALTNVPDNLVRNIDLLGAYGPGVGMRPGWLDEGEVKYRVAEITLGIILNDTFAQGA
jgi:hypothetical protein